MSRSGIIHTEHTGYICGRLDCKAAGGVIGRAYLSVGMGSDIVQLGGIGYNDSDATQSTIFTIPVRNDADITVTLEGESYLYSCCLVAPNFQ